MLGPREDLAGIPVYSSARPGAVPVRVRASSNEAPGPVPAPVVAAVLEAAERGTRYPAIAGQDLADAVAATHGVPPAQVVVGEGSLAVLERVLLAYVRPGESVVMAWRSYEAYPLSTRVAHGEARLVPLTPDGRHDLAAMAAAVDRTTRVVIVCNPNNPTGTVVPWPELEDFLDRLPDHVLAILDEAYLDFADDPGRAIADRLAARANLVVLRTFSKAHALAGLRVGYAVASAPVAASLRAVSLPFPVSRPAVAAATCSLAHPAWVAQRVQTVRAERGRVSTLLTNHGLPVLPSQANFVWTPLAGRSAAFAELAAEHGVLLRPFADEGVRITVGESTLAPALEPVLTAWAGR